MMEFINEHAEWLANVVTVLGGVGAMIGLFWHHLNKRFDMIDRRFDKIDQRIDNLTVEQHKFHTRLTWLDGYIARHEELPRKWKGEKC